MAAAELDLNWDTRLFCPFPNVSLGKLIVPARSAVDNPTSGIPRRAFNWLNLRREYFQWLGKQAPRYDAILLRHSLSDPVQTAFIKKTKTPVYLVHHTLEVPELRRSYSAIDKSLRVNAEIFFGNETLKSAHGIIAVTDEILHYERGRVQNQKKAGYIYPNGIYYPNGGKGHGVDQRGSVPEILFVAGYFARWHGLDLLLNSLEHSNSDFVLHLVGKLDPKDHSRATLDRRIEVHGVLDCAQLREVSQKCWIGLSSFALDRKSMKQACTLKVREYLFNGLPVYANYTDVFPGDFKFYKIGPPNIERILDYARQVRSATRIEVAEQAGQFISKTALLAKLYDWLKIHAATIARNGKPAF